jgi:septum formation protein
MTSVYNTLSILSLLLAKIEASDHMKQIILASTSPRRKWLMEEMGLTFKVVPSSFTEYFDHARSTEDVAIELALGKARKVAQKHLRAVVIGSDTIVTFNDKQLGKPKDEQEARQTLASFAGEMNIVTTAVVVICKELGVEWVDVVSSRVFFKPLDMRAVEKYVGSGDWHDKAGSYGVQSGAAPLVDRIEGEYDAVLGLPTRPLAKQLKRLGFACHPANVESLVPITPLQ